MNAAGTNRRNTRGRSSLRKSGISSRRKHANNVRPTTAPESRNAVAVSGSAATSPRLLSRTPPDMATALSASGPAYVFLFIEALIDSGVYLGMSRDVARKLAVQTVLGSARLVEESGRPPAELREMVTSPGGTTAEALMAFERRGFRGVVQEAVVAAYDKSVQLGRQS